MAIAYEFDLTEAKDLESVGAGSKYPKAGWYHTEISEVIDETQTNKTPAIKMGFHILAGTKPGEIGKIHHEKLYMTEKTRDRLALFAKKLGLLTTACVGKKVTVDWDSAVGKSCIIELKDEDYTKPDGTPGRSSKIDYAGIYDVNDPKVKDVPKDKNFTQVNRVASKPKDQFADL